MCHAIDRVIRSSLQTLVTFEQVSRRKKTTLLAPSCNNSPFLASPFYSVRNKLATSVPASSKSRYFFSVASRVLLIFELTQLGCVSGIPLKQIPAGRCSDILTRTREIN